MIEYCDSYEMDGCYCTRCERGVLGSICPSCGAGREGGIVIDRFVVRKYQRRIINLLLFKVYGEWKRADG